MVSRNYADSLHLSPDDFRGKTDLDLGFPEDLVKGNSARGIRGFWTDDRQVMDTGKPLVNLNDPATVDGVAHLFHTIKTPLRQTDGTIWAVLGVAQDVTRVTQAESALKDSLLQQANYIQTQAELIRELSTPLIPVQDGVVVMPIIGIVDNARAEQIMSTLLNGIVAHHANTVILDVTGMKTLDTHVAGALLQAAKAARLLGTRVILTGISPSVAQTLVTLGVDLQSIDTQRTLQHGITRASSDIPVRQ